ncbi:MAG: MFS transporter, partial [Anaerolineales bacterium]
LIAFTVPLAIIGTFRPENASRVLLMGTIFGFVSAAPLLVVFFCTRERKEHLELEQPKFRDSLRAAIKNRPFVFGAIIFLITWVSIDILQATLLYFIKYVLKRETQSDAIMAAIFITAILALPLWEWAARRLNKRLAYGVGVAFWAVVQLILISINATVPFQVIFFLCILAGIGVSAAHVLPWSILPDAIEWDEYQTGSRHEGMFYSLVTLAQKIASSLAIPLALLILDASGYVPNATQQPASALLGIRLVIGPLPALLLTIGIVFAIAYPLNRQTHARIVQELEERRLSHKQEVA